MKLQQDLLYYETTYVYSKDHHCAYTHLLLNSLLFVRISSLTLKLCIISNLFVITVLDNERQTRYNILVNKVRLTQITATIIDRAALTTATIVYRSTPITTTIIDRPTLIMTTIVERPVQIMTTIVNRPVQIKATIVDRPVQIKATMMDRPAHHQ